MQGSSGEDDASTLLFEADGYVVVEESAPIDLVAGSCDSALRAWESLLAEIQRRSGKSIGLSQRGGYREIVQRHTGRYELRYGLEALSELEEAIINGPAMRIARAALGDDCVILDRSCIVADLDCQEQTWHIDGGHLSTSRHESCHCLNIFTPLVSLESGGGTEIRPGSHYLTRDLKKQFLLAKARKTLRDPTVPSLSLGNSLLFDYRVLHRGTRNNTGSPRPVFVITLAKPWFKDILNFPARSLFDINSVEATSQ